MSEPSVNASFLLKAVRTFLAAVVGQPPPGPTTGAGGGGGGDDDDVASAAAGGGGGKLAATAGGSVGHGGGPDDATVSFEEAGCLVWDVAALPDDAAFLLDLGLPAMLQPVLTAAAARQHWRALEIGLGILGNLACHGAAKQQLLGQQGLPELLLDRLLWQEDAASLAELCRCLAGLLTDGGQAADCWWGLLLREETLGRLVWIVEDTLNSLLLERALNLLTVIIAAGGAYSRGGSASGGAGLQQQLVRQLLSLDLLPLLASVLHGWLAKLHTEQRQFGEGGPGSGGGSRGASEGSSASRDDWGALPAADASRQQQGAAGTAADEQLAGGQAPAPAHTGVCVVEAGGSAPLWAPPAGTTSCGGAATAAAAGTDAAAGTPGPAAVAAEVTEAAVLEALALLEALAADAAGEEALNASDAVKDALLQLLAKSEHRGMQALSTLLLAGLKGVGPQLLQHPPALSAVLSRLADVAGQQQRGTGDAPAAAGGTPAAGLAAAAAAGGAEQQAEDVEAAWALCAALAHTLSQQHQQAGTEQATQQQGAAVAEALAVLEDYVDALCHNWGSSGGGGSGSLRQQAAYALHHLVPLLAQRPGVTRQQQQALRAALEQSQAGA